MTVQRYVGVWLQQWRNKLNADTLDSSVEAVVNWLTSSVKEIWIRVKKGRSGCQTVAMDNWVKVGDQMGVGGW